MRTFRVSARRVLLAAGTLALTSLAGTAPAVQDAPVTLGELLTNGAVQVESRGTSLTIEDSTWAYLSGDRVYTEDGSSAALRLEGDGGLFVASRSALAVRGTKGSYTVSLESGGVRFSFREGVDFRVKAAGAVVQPEAFRTVADDGARRVGGIVVIEDGKPTVSVTEGSLAVRGQGRSGFQTVQAGETYSDEGGGEFIKVQTPQEGEGGRRLLAWLLFGSLGAYAIYELTEDDASP